MKLSSPLTLALCAAKYSKDHFVHYIHFTTEMINMIIYSTEPFPEIISEYTDLSARWGDIWI